MEKKTVEKLDGFQALDDSELEWLMAVSNPQATIEETENSHPQIQ